MLIICISIDAYKLVVYMLLITNRTNRTIYPYQSKRAEDRIESHSVLS